MKLAEYCQETEAGLGNIEACLLQFQPEALQRCQDEISVVLEQLLSWKGSQEPLDESDRTALASLRKALRKLQARADQGMNLCLGWRQLRMTAGYTSQGQPQFVATESNSSFEG